MCFAVNFGLGFGLEGGGFLSFLDPWVGIPLIFGGRLTLEEVAHFLVFVFFFNCAIICLFSFSFSSRFFCSIFLFLSVSFHFISYPL